MFNFWSTPEGLAMQGLPPIPPPLWVPVYQAIQYVIEAGVTTQEQPINPQYLLSTASAGYLAVLYGATLTQVPFLAGSGGGIGSSAIENVLNWVGVSPNTQKQITYSMNAGFLAYYYKPAGPANNPNGVDLTVAAGTAGSGQPAPGVVSNPAIAVVLCSAAIQQAWMAALQAAEGPSTVVGIQGI